MVMLTHEDLISDLWVLSESGNHGIRRQLLGQGESEIVVRGDHKIKPSPLFGKANLHNAHSA